MTLADARPELLFNQLTGGSNSVHSLYNQVRVAAAIAKGQLTAAAAKALATPAQGLKIKHGIIRAPDGRATNYGSLTRKAAARRSKAVVARLKSPLAVLARGHAAAAHRRPGRGDRTEAVRARPRRPQRPADDGLPAADDQRHRAGRRQPRPGQGDARRHRRRRHPAQQARGRRRGCARPDLRPVHRRRARAVGQLGARARRPASPMRPCSRPAAGRAADDAGAAGRRSTSASPSTSGPATRWRPTARSPTSAPTGRDLVLPEVADLGPGAARARSRAAGRQRDGARDRGRRFVRPPPVRRRRVRGRRDLQGDGQAGQADVAPHRQLPPGPRAPDVHLARARSPTWPTTSWPSTSATPAWPPTSATGSASCCRRQVANLPEGNFLGYSQSIFTLTANVPYNFGAVTQLLNEVYDDDARSTPASVRNIYSPEVTTAKELMVDQVAKAMGQDPYAVPPRVRERRPHEGRARRGRQGGELGPRRCRPGRRRASPSTTSTRASRPASSRSTAGRRRSTGRSRTATPARA